MYAGFFTTDVSQNVDAGSFHSFDGLVNEVITIFSLCDKKS